MLITKPYSREHAVLYARRYAFSQNPVFGNFRGIGGNCTNFVSQCVYAGACAMNYTPVYGWYYISMDDRTASWTGVEYFYNFMTGNRGIGPFGREVAKDELEVGDVIQLGREEDGFYHTVLVVGFDGDDPLVAAQTDDALDRPLSTYRYDFARYIKIEGVRLRMPDTSDCFTSVYEGTAILPDVSTLPDGSGEPPLTEEAPAAPQAPAELPAPAAPQEPTEPQTPAAPSAPTEPQTE